MNDFGTGFIAGFMTLLFLFFIGDGLFLSDVTTGNVRNVSVIQGTNEYIYKNATLQFEAMKVSGASLQVLAPTDNGTIEKWFTLGHGCS